MPRLIYTKIVIFWGRDSIKVPFWGKALWLTNLIFVFVTTVTSFLNNFFNKWIIDCTDFYGFNIYNKN